MNDTDCFRQPHILRETKSNDRPQQIILLEVTARRERQVFDQEHFQEHFLSARIKRYRRRGTEKTRMRETTCDSIQEVWNEIFAFMSPGTCTYLFAMDAFSALTLLGFWEQLAEKKWELIDSRDKVEPASRNNVSKRWRGYAVMERPPTIVVARVTGTNKTLKVLDPQNYGIRDWQDMLPVYIKTVHGRMLYYDFPTDPTLRQLFRIDALENWLDRFIELLDTLDMGSMQNTSASQALHSFRHRFMSSPIIIHGNQPALKLERQAYHGGRCEAYMIGHIGAPRTLFPPEGAVSVEPKIWEGTGKIYHLDVSSMYLALTAKAIVPTQLKGYYSGAFLSGVDLSTMDGLPIADVDLEVDMPAFPVVTEAGLSFPVGRFRTQLAGPEIEIAILNNAIRKVHSVALYDGAELFKEWSTTWCEMKEAGKRTGNKAAERMAKSIGVSLFGKFGQQNWEWIDCPQLHAVYPYEQWLGRHPETQDVCHWRSFVWRVQYQGNKKEHYHSFPGLAAWVTSLGRACLWNLMLAAGRKNVYYVDTDSLWTNEEGYKRLSSFGVVNQTTPGMLRLVEEVSSLYIWGIKHYRADDRIVCAGMSNKVKCNEFGYASWEEQESMSAAMWQRRPADGNVVTRTVAINREYALGKVDKEGRVSPLILKEW